MSHEFIELMQSTPLECAEMNPNYWFADPLDDEEEFGNSERAIAVGVCQRCPIRWECFDYAVENGIEEGVWGGSIPRQRAAYAEKVRLNIPRYSSATEMVRQD